MRVAFWKCKNYSHIFSKNISIHAIFNDQNFNNTLTNDIVSLNNWVQGPDVQSIVSLTTSLRVISLTVLADSIYHILIIFADKMWVAFAMQKLLTFFQQKISAYLRISRCKF